MFKNKLGEDSPISKFIHLKIRRRDGVESLTILEEGEFKVPIDSCINSRHVSRPTLTKFQWKILKHLCCFPYNLEEKRCLVPVMSVIKAPL